MNRLRNYFFGISYSELCAWIISFNLLDMLTTDLILFHGAGNSLEVNDIASSLHGSPNIILFRAATLLIISVFLIIGKIKYSELILLRAYPAFRILMGKIASRSRSFDLRLGMFIFAAVISTSRLFIAVSNVSGELFGISLTILVELLLPNSSIRVIGMVAVVTVSIASSMLIACLWELYRTSVIQAPIKRGQIG